MLATYAPLLRVPGVRAFLLGSFLARIGCAMFGVAVVTMVAGRTGSYGLAGSVSGVGLVVMAFTVPRIGRLVDRFGQRRVTLPMALNCAAWTTVLVILSATGAPTWTLFVVYPLALLVGSPPTMSRARWGALLPGQPARLHSAMSLEQVLDELGFVLGPALGAFAGAVLFPEAGMILAGACYVVGSLVFCAARATEPVPDAGQTDDRGSVLANPGIVLLTLVLTMTGCIFGANEVVTLAVAQDAGARSLGGIVIALFALGSAISGLVYGSRTVTVPLSRALILGAAAMALLEAPVLLVTDLAPLAVVLMVAGAATAPTLITAMTITQRLVPASRVNEAMGLVVTGLVIGVALSSSVAGWVSERAGAHSGYLVAVVAGVVAVLLALAGRPVLRRADDPGDGAPRP